MEIQELVRLSNADLRRQMAARGLRARYREHDLCALIRQASPEARIVGGFLEPTNHGGSCLRDERRAGLAYVSPQLRQACELRDGDHVIGIAEPREGVRLPPLTRVLAVNGEAVERAKGRPHFERLTPVFPDRRYRLGCLGDFSMRVLDVVAPVGKGQRGLIVAPPKAGKTTLLYKIAQAIRDGYPEVHLMVVLIAERPEEATCFEREVGGELIVSTFDQQPAQQTQAAEFALRRAKRLVEGGRDVFVLLDSLTRLTRAYNLCAGGSGRALSGGIDPAALAPAREFLGCARNLEGGGSLTVIATALVNTGSRMDDFIYEEFKGTGNMEILLSSEIANQRTFPAIDILASGTRNEERLLEEGERAIGAAIRRAIQGYKNGSLVQGSAALIQRWAAFERDAEFFALLRGTLGA